MYGITPGTVLNVRSDTEPQEQAPASVGDRMLALRNALGLTQDQLAARGSIDAHPLTYRDVLNIEKGRNRATSGRIREALGTRRRLLSML